MPAALELNPVRLLADLLSWISHLANTTTLLADPPAIQLGAWVEKEGFPNVNLWFDVNSATSTAPQAMPSPLPEHKRLFRWGFSARMCEHVLKILKYNHTTGRKASKSPPLPHDKPNELLGLPQPVNTDILVSRLATLDDFACFSALRDPTQREEQLITTELAAPT